jgi:hypothetical protein
MPSVYQQHLNSRNMRVIDAALARVRAIYGLERGSEEERRVAAVMIGEFQIGNTTEDGLFAIFLGPLDTALHAQRKQQMRQALGRWEDEGRAGRLRELAA